MSRLSTTFRGITGWAKYQLKTVLGRDQRFMPEEFRRDDVFVVSYPKSGNTWVRFLLANALYPEVDVNFDTVDELIPEVVDKDHEKAPACEMRRSNLPPPRLLKSHAPYRSSYPRVIYILRDGRDVYASYYNFRRPDFSEETMFEEFLEAEHWPTRWSDHVDGWMKASDSRDNILVVRFEDLKEDSARELRRMISFIGKEPMSDARIQRATEASSFENMCRLEEEKGGVTKPVRFMRKGKVGSWQELFTDEARDIFKRKEGETLLRFGYAEDHEW